MIDGKPNPLTLVAASFLSGTRSRSSSEKGTAGTASCLFLEESRQLTCSAGQAYAQEIRPVIPSAKGCGNHDGVEHHETMGGSIFCSTKDQAGRSGSFAKSHPRDNGKHGGVAASRRSGAECLKRARVCTTTRRGYPENRHGRMAFAIRPFSLISSKLTASQLSLSTCRACDRRRRPACRPLPSSLPAAR